LRRARWAESSNASLRTDGNGTRLRSSQTPGNMWVVAPTDKHIALKNMSVVTAAPPPPGGSPMQIDFHNPTGAAGFSMLNNSLRATQPAAMDGHTQVL